MTTKQMTRNYRMSNWVELFREHTQSNMDVKEFCRIKGITKHQYYYWKRLLREAAVEGMQEAQEKSTSLALNGFAEVQLSDSPTEPSYLQRGQLSIEYGELRLMADCNYPVESLSLLLRSLATS